MKKMLKTAALLAAFAGAPALAIVVDVVMSPAEAAQPNCCPNKCRTPLQKSKCV